MTLLFQFWNHVPVIRYLFLISLVQGCCFCVCCARGAVSWRSGDYFARTVKIQLVSVVFGRYCLLGLCSSLWSLICVCAWRCSILGLVICGGQVEEEVVLGVGNGSDVNICATMINMHYIVDYVLASSSAFTVFARCSRTHSCRSSSNLSSRLGRLSSLSVCIGGDILRQDLLFVGVVVGLIRFHVEGVSFAGSCCATAWGVLLRKLQVRQIGTHLYFVASHYATQRKLTFSCSILRRTDRSIRSCVSSIFSASILCLVHRVSLIKSPRCGLITICWITGGRVWRHSLSRTWLLLHSLFFVWINNKFLDIFGEHC